MSSERRSSQGKLLTAAAMVVALLAGVTVRAQPAPPALKFDVASVRLAPPPDGRTSPRHLSGIPGPNNNDPGRFSARANLLSLILTAYEIPGYRLSEQSDLGLVRLDVEATMPADATREQFDVMLQNLLADRIGLRVHWASKTIDTYSLVVARGGPKLKPAAPDSPAEKNSVPPATGTRLNGFPVPPAGNDPWFAQTPDGKIGMRGHNQTIPELIGEIGPRTLNGPLTDATGLTGRYDYTLFWSMAAQTAALNPPSAAEPNGPSIFDAVQDQLGLKIEKTRSPVQVLVVDHVDGKPTGN
ncbi:MAG TPA: TIGR03435 family protein [Bryobacteraceae bacterium]|nr:TIGR03435 family protein [Bryobacteraceae bacterium]